MAAARTDFWELERRNRRDTAILVVVFIALFTALGFGLDFCFHDLAIVDGSLTGLVGAQKKPDIATKRETISINEDPFFNAPLETVECASDRHMSDQDGKGAPGSAKTSRDGASRAVAPAGAPTTG